MGAGGCWLVILDSFRQLEYFLFVHRFNIFLNTSFQFSLIHGRFVCVLEVELLVTGTHSPFQKKKKKERKKKQREVELESLIISKELAVGHEAVTLQQRNRNRYTDMGENIWR
jgi:hypothetical protein